MFQGSDECTTVCVHSKNGCSTNVNSLNLLDCRVLITALFVMFAVEIQRVSLRIIISGGHALVEKFVFKTDRGA